MLRQMAQEFKEFMSRGNVPDLAVAVVLGAAFTAIINSLVNDIVMPLLGIFLGGVNFGGLTLNVGQASIHYGNFIQALINFLLIGLVLFLFIRSLNKIEQNLLGITREETPTKIKLLTEIRDLLKKKDA